MQARCRSDGGNRRDFRNTYPSIAAEPIVEEFGATRVGDPYRSLESETSSTIEWQIAQNSFAREYLQSWEGYAALRAEIVDELRHSRASAPRRAGERWVRIASR